jgi:hypothetical protein
VWLHRFFQAETYNFCSDVPTDWIAHLQLV